MQTGKIDVHDNDPLAAIRGLMRAILTLEEIEAVMVPLREAPGVMPMPTLVGDPGRLDAMEPLAPAFALNAAKMAARLTHKPAPGRIAVWLRPCEIRAFIELVKLNQGSRERLLIIGADCPGAYTNRDFRTLVADDPLQATRQFDAPALAGSPQACSGIDLASACRACIEPLPQGADLAVNLIGIDIAVQVTVQAQTAAGDELLDRLDLLPGRVPDGRAVALEAFLSRRAEQRKRLFEITTAATENLEKLSAYLQNCVNCYNCRVACPVCYCRECVFVTDVFDHDPLQYQAWALRKGAVKLPTDTLFYHLTRMAHISTACVGCGQCTNACPNDIDVMALMALVAHRTQAAFGYRAGHRQEEKPPLTVFEEKEFEDVVGIEG